MCEHCGCRGVEPIAKLMDEHFEMLDLSGDIRHCLVSGDHRRAARLLDVLGDRLAPHARREERGIFAALREKDEFVEELRGLEEEHAAFDEILAGLDPGTTDFPGRVLALLDDLSLHIDRENLGIFPIAVVTLGASGWDLVAEAGEEGAVGVSQAHRG